jgi:uncharacterized protein YbaA (DUF1428 family)
MAYVDAFIVPVPRANLARYAAMAELAAKVWTEHGALDYREWLADDAPFGDFTSFPRAVQLKPDEVVVFAVITFADRAHRDAVNARVMGDPRMQAAGDETPPFESRRMVFGGFAPLIEA